MAEGASSRAAGDFLRQQLRRLADEVRRVAEGDLDHPLDGGRPAELAEVAEAVDALRARLVRERSSVAPRSLLMGQEDERRRLAMGIHDDTIQSVLAASLRLQRLRRHLRSNGSEGIELVQQVQHDLDQAISRLRRLVFELHPPTLDREGLPDAMRLYLAETLEPEGITWSVTVSGEEIEDEVTAALVYRLFREAVLNAVRHAQPTTVEVTLVVGSSDVAVTITDDGVGFDAEHGSTVRPGHLGMKAGRTLSEGVGGCWQVESAPGAGTRVRFRVPRSLA